MRRFVVLGHEAPLEPGFPLSDLPGAGRLDVLCRCVAAALLTSHGVREEAEVWLVLQDALTVRFDGGAVRSLSPDERAVAGLVNKALGAADRAVGAQAVEASPGVSVAKGGLADALEAAAEEGTVVQLHEDGDDVADFDPAGPVTFVLSDHRDFTPEEDRLLGAEADARLSLGPTALHADQAIAVVHNHLDRLGR
ncbi:MAG: tRNA (pseudouridine(54)-N(1))-methyltransferase TrmY [Halobacteriales archaeon]|nr:tRNA (pseudouridine(54)-N(1))-methyltransferase TrmY [Halobacteriales archaeon]